MKRFLLALALSLPTAAAANVPCGGGWSAFMDGVREEARGKGIPDASINAIIRVAQQSSSVLRNDRRQSAFKQSFLEFSGRTANDGRVTRGRQMAQKYANTFARAERDFGIPSEVILAFWAMETDYGAFMGDKHTVSALATLAHDCRRPHIFRRHLIAAMALNARGDFPANTVGAWAGEIGHVQMLPGDIFDLGVDGDGDGQVNLKASAPDAILTAAAMLNSHGWRRGEPWLVEVTAPDGLDWGLSGFGNERRVSDWAQLGVTARAGNLPRNLDAALLLPMGRKGPKFLAFHNFRNVYLEWNKSLVNTMTAAYLANRIAGAERYLKGNPEQILSLDQMKLLQTRLDARGYDVGGIDGILGAGTRAAVRAEQAKQGFPADGWPTRQFLNALR